MANETSFEEATLHQLSFTPQELHPGDSLALTYDVTAHDRSGQEIAFGASLIAADGTEYYDLAGDATVRLANGRQTYSRHLKADTTIPAGTYRLVGALWSPAIGAERLATVSIDSAVRIKA